MLYYFAYLSAQKFVTVQSLYSERATSLSICVASWICKLQTSVTYFYPRDVLHSSLGGVLLLDCNDWSTGFFFLTHWFLNSYHTGIFVACIGQTLMKTGSSTTYTLVWVMCLSFHGKTKVFK